MSSNYPPWQRQTLIDRICEVLLLSEISNDSSKCLTKQTETRIGGICTTFLQSERLDVASKQIATQMCIRIAIGHI